MPPKKKNRPSAQQRRMERIRRAFDADALVRILEQPESHFIEYADYHYVEPRKSWRGWSSDDAFYFYKDNGAPILAVAHLDNVQSDRTATILDTKDGKLVLSGALDDRLGAYVILELLPKLGIKVDWLLTTNEEVGASTAADFILPAGKSYNWMIEFDRGGTDVVMYQYEDKEMCKLVEASGARVGMGSYSDIADLDDLGCVGFNWGVGYYDYHSKRAHAWLEDTFKMVSKFMRFYAANAATHLPYIDVPSYIAQPARYTREWWDDLEAQEELVDEHCPACDAELDSWRGCWECGYGIIDNEEEIEARRAATQRRMDNAVSDDVAEVLDETDRILRDQHNFRGSEDDEDYLRQQERETLMDLDREAWGEAMGG